MSKVKKSFGSKLATFKSPMKKGIYHLSTSCANANCANCSTCAGPNCIRSEA